MVVFSHAPETDQREYYCASKCTMTVYKGNGARCGQFFNERRLFFCEAWAVHLPRLPRRALRRRAQNVM